MINFLIKPNQFHPQNVYHAVEVASKVNVLVIPNHFTCKNVMSGSPVFSFIMSLNLSRKVLPAFQPKVRNMFKGKDHFPHQLSDKDKTHNVLNILCLYFHLTLFSHNTLIQRISLSFLKRKIRGPGSAKKEERVPLHLGLMVPVVQ